MELNIDKVRTLLSTNIIIPSSFLLYYLVCQLYSRASKLIETEIDLLLPDDNFIRVKVANSSVLSPSILVQHPNIKAWHVVGVDDPTICVRMDFISKDFHGMLMMLDGDIVYIYASSSDSNNLYHSMNKSENHSNF